MEKIFVLSIYGIGESKPSVYVSKERSKCVEKAFELVEMSNDEDDEYGWDKEYLEEIHEQLRNTGEFNDGTTSYVIEESELM
jgi:hypothetical protein